MFNWLFGSKPIHTCEYRKRTEIISISEPSLQEFYNSLTWDKKYEMTSLAYGHRCRHMYCCDHEDIIDNNKRSDRELSEFLSEHSYDISKRSRYVSFTFSDYWSVSRYIVKSEEAEFRSLTNEKYITCEVNLASKIHEEAIRTGETMYSVTLGQTT